jgi:5'-methylthioadenosine phosphorylase
LKKNLDKADIAIIGGSGIENLLKKSNLVRIGTPHGIPPPISVGMIEEKPVAFLPRHGFNHAIPPHQLNNHANIYALKELGVKRVIATNAVGSLKGNLKPGCLAIPYDFIDFTKNRKYTFFDFSPVTHIDMTNPFCPEILNTLVEATRQITGNTLKPVVLACTEGPRYETPAEVKMLRNLGCDIVGMTTVPEAVLARELGICYASICLISNMASGLQEKQTVSEMAKLAKEKRSVIRQILKKAVVLLPHIRSCECAHALRDSRL